MHFIKFICGRAYKVKACLKWEGRLPHCPTHTHVKAKTNLTSDQWSYLHGNRIFVIIIILGLSPIISCLLCCINWYSSSIIRSSPRAHTHSLLIRTF